MKYPERDLLFYEDDDNFNGDLQVENNGLKLASSKQTIKQEVINRINTNNPDWYRHFNNGADLEDLRGMDQAKSTADLGVDRIIKALTHDNKFNAVDLRVEGIPTAMNEVTYFIFIDIGEREPLTITHSIDL